MDVFETKIRGFHAKAVQNIMARTTGFKKYQSKQKAIKSKGDNITTYLRKFQIDRENLNLAKRILLCESEHDHKIYEKEWKKTENFMRVRSNFKRSLCNQQPRIFKFQPIQGRGTTLITLQFTKFQSSPIHFRPQNLYQLKILLKASPISPTNSTFTLAGLGSTPMSFYVPRAGAKGKKKQVTCKIYEIKENQVYERGRMVVPLLEGDWEVEIFGKLGKVVAVVWVTVGRGGRNLHGKKSSENNSSFQNHFLEKSDYYQNASQQNI